MGNGIGKVCLCSAGAGEISRRHEINSPFGNSICYVRPPDSFSDDDAATNMTTFRSVSGASVSANSSTPPSTTATTTTVVSDSSASFESSTSFTSSSPIPLPHHAWRAGYSSAGRCSDVWWSPTEKVFSSEPLENPRNSFSHNHEYGFGNKPKKQNLMKILKRVISGSISIVVKEKKKKKKEKEYAIANSNANAMVIVDDDNYLDGDEGGDLFMMGSENLEWAQGRAGEDRVHIVISEENEWVFVGIYDGFNGPDATDYLLHNLFYAIYDELNLKSEEEKVLGLVNENNDDGYLMVNGYYCSSSSIFKKLNDEVGDVKRASSSSTTISGFSHSGVLLALSEALRKTEDAFLKGVDEVINKDPVLAMMGSCVLVMLMKGEDVYLMNVGDSHAVLATTTTTTHHHGSAKSLQLTMEHSTFVKEEVHRIRKEHPDDPFAITKGRVKGYLNVTRAFGAGFLKQPKQNNAVLEAFKVKYIGDSPYITCSPSLNHHRLTPSDRFLILSSDGLHQYFTNEEAVAKVESFITLSPDTDPAQLLIKEALSRAANKAGMDFHELLDIP